MRSNIAIKMVMAHAEGEVGNVVVDGVDPPPGDTLWAQRDFLHSDGHLRALLLNEPRGGGFCHVNLLVPPKHSKAVFGFLTMEPEHTPPMSGSNTICVATVLLETGRVPMTGDETRFTLESAAGPIEIVADTTGRRANSITLTNVASFADQIGVALEIEGYPGLIVDTAFGGDSFVLVDAASLGFQLVPNEARDLAELGAKITRAANKQLGFSHPNQDWNHISFCQFTNPLTTEDGVKSGLSAVVIDPGKIDRSPTGTGCSARLAVMAAKGEIGLNEAFVGRSLIGGRFDCSIIKTTRIGDRPAVIPSIRGRGFVTGTAEVMRDPDDPWPEGYRLSDTWPLMPD